jgi:hypothetical protein
MFREESMRLARLAPLLLALLAGPAMAAQQWIDFVDRERFFSINLPEQPTAEDIKYDTEDNFVMPARRYTARQGPATYVVTVVDFGTGELTTVRGSVAYEAMKYRTRGGRVTFDAYAHIDRVEGHQLQLTNPDGTRTYVAIHLNNKRLYIFDATVPAGAVPPAAFQVSAQFLDANGNSIRYNIDFDGQRLQGRGGGGGGGAAGGGRGGQGGQGAQ